MDSVKNKNTRMIAAALIAAGLIVGAGIGCNAAISNNQTDRIVTKATEATKTDMQSYISSYNADLASQIKDMQDEINGLKSSATTEISGEISSLLTPDVIEAFANGDEGAITKFEQSIIDIINKSLPGSDEEKSVFAKKVISLIESQIRGAIPTDGKVTPEMAKQIAEKLTTSSKETITNYVTDHNIAVKSGNSQIESLPVSDKQKALLIKEITERITPKLVREASKGNEDAIIELESKVKEIVKENTTSSPVNQEQLSKSVSTIVESEIAKYISGSEKANKQNLEPLIKSIKKNASDIAELQKAQNNKLGQADTKIKMLESRIQTIVKENSTKDTSTDSTIKELQTTIENNFNTLSQVFNQQKAEESKAADQLTAKNEALLSQINTEKAEREKTIEELKKTIENNKTTLTTDLNKVKEELTKIVNDNKSEADEKINNTVTMLQSKINALEKEQNEALNNSVTELTNLINQNETTTNAQIKELTQKLEKNTTTLQDNIDDVANNLEALKQSHEALTETFNTYKSDTDKTFAQVNASIKDLSDALNKERDERIDADLKLQAQINSNVKDLTDSIDKTASDFSKDLKKAEIALKSSNIDNKKEYTDLINKANANSEQLKKSTKAQIDAIIADTHMTQEQKDREIRELIEKYNKELTNTVTDLQDKVKVNNDAVIKTIDKTKETLEKNIDTTNKGLDSLSALLEKETAERIAADRDLQNQISASVNDLNKSIDESSDLLTQNLERAKKALADSNEANKDEYTKLINDVSDESQELVNNTKAQIQSIIDDSNKTQAEKNAEIDVLVKDLNDRLATKVNDLQSKIDSNDSAVQNALDRTKTNLESSINTMNEQLGSLTQLLTAEADKREKGDKALSDRLDQYDNNIGADTHIWTGTRSEYKVKEHKAHTISFVSED